VAGNPVPDRSLYIGAFYWNCNSDLDSTSWARRASLPVGQLVMPRTLNPAKINRRGKGLSRAEKIAVGVVIFLAVWAAYSFSQPPAATTTTTSHSFNALIESATHATATSTASTQAQASFYPLAPDFTLPVVDPSGPTGETASLSSFRGKVVLLEFMTPWCSHCQSMAPVLEQLYERFAPQNVVFLSVSGTFGGATVEDTVRFIRDHNSSWICVYDSSGSVFNQYGVTGTPTFFIIGKNADIASSHVGAVAFEILLNDLTRANV
jgi:thiol-disulfide isomerase/thioredoxin